MEKEKNSQQLVQQGADVVYAIDVSDEREVNTGHRKKRNPREPPSARQPESPKDPVQKHQRHHIKQEVACMMKKRIPRQDELGRNASGHS